MANKLIDYRPPLVHTAMQADSYSTNQAWPAMLFSFKAIKHDNINNVFTIGSPAAKVRDPFCSSSGFLGHRLLNEDSHFPILFAESSSNSTSGLLFFISKNDDRIITWEVTTQADDTVKQTRQIQCSRIELALLLTLTDNSAQECRECIHQSISVPAHL